jgi:large subunit ribosomal protein L11
MSFKTTPVTYLVLKAAGLDKGRKGTDRGGDPKNTVGKITKADVKKIAEYKINELNVDSLEAAERCVEGSCKSMGIAVVD